MHLELCQQITLSSTSLDEHLGEVLVEEYLFELWCRVECYLDNFSLAIGIGGEINDTRSWGSNGQVVFAIASNRRHVEALDIIESFLSVTIHHIINSALVVFLKHTKPQYILSYEYLICHTDDLELTIFVEDNDIIDIGTVADKLVFLQSCTYKSIGTVDIEFLIGLNNLGSLDGIEVADFGLSRMILTIFLFKELKPIGGDLYKVVEVAVNLFDFLLDACHEFVGFILVELKDSLHLNLKQLENIILGYLTNQLWIVGSEAFVNMFAYRIDIGCLFEFAVFIDALFDEYLFK